MQLSKLVSCQLMSACLTNDISKPWQDLSRCPAV